MNNDIPSKIASIVKEIIGSVLNKEKKVALSPSFADICTVE